MAFHTAAMANVDYLSCLWKGFQYHWSRSIDSQSPAALLKEKHCLSLLSQEAGELQITLPFPSSCLSVLGPAHLPQSSTHLAHRPHSKRCRSFSQPGFLRSLRSTARTVYAGSALSEALLPISLATWYSSLNTVL